MLFLLIHNFLSSPHSCMWFDLVNFWSISLQLLNTLPENLLKFVFLLGISTPLGFGTAKDKCVGEWSLWVHVEIYISIMVIYLESRLSFIDTLLITFHQFFVSWNLQVVELCDYFLKLLFGENVRIFHEFGQKIVNFSPVFWPSEYFVNGFLFRIWIIGLQIFYFIFIQQILNLFRQLVLLFNYLIFSHEHSIRLLVLHLGH